MRRCGRDGLCHLYTAVIQVNCSYEIFAVPRRKITAVTVTVLTGLPTRRSKIEQIMSVPKVLIAAVVVLLSLSCGALADATQGAPSPAAPGALYSRFSSPTTLHPVQQHIHVAIHLSLKLSLPMLLAHHTVRPWIAVLDMSRH